MVKSKFVMPWNVKVGDVIFSTKYRAWLKVTHIEKTKSRVTKGTWWRFHLERFATTRGRWRTGFEDYHGKTEFKPAERVEVAID